MIFLLFFIYFESKKTKNYIFINFSLSFGLLNLPDATNGRFFFENLIMAGILKAANLSTRNSFKVSSLRVELSFKKIEAHSSSPSLSSGIPKTQASKTSGCLYIAFST